MLEPASLQRDVDVKAKASEQVEGGICTMDRTAMANKSTYELVPQPRSCLLLLYASFFSCCCAFCHAIIMISVPQQHLSS